MSRRTTSERATRGRRDGFTIIELLFAAVILCVGILALVSSASIILRQMAGGAQQSLAATTIINRFESANAGGCSALASGSVTGAQVSESWTVADSGRVKYLTETVTYTSAGRQRSQSVTGLVLCQ